MPCIFLISWLIMCFSVQSPTSLAPRSSIICNTPNRLWIKFILSNGLWGSALSEPYRDRSDVHPCEKVIGMFFQNQIWSRLLDITRLRFAWIKKPLRKLKSAKYLSAVINRGWVMKHWKKHYVNFAMSSSITELWRRWVSLTMKCAFCPKYL